MVHRWSRSFVERSELIESGQVKRRRNEREPGVCRLGASTVVRAGRWWRRAPSLSICPSTDVGLKPAAAIGRDRLSGSDLHRHAHFRGAIDHADGASSNEARAARWRSRRRPASTVCRRQNSRPGSQKNSERDTGSRSVPSARVTRCKPCAVRSVSKHRWSAPGRVERGVTKSKRQLRGCNW